jgi:hypothetical protein
MLNCQNTNTNEKSFNSNQTSNCSHNCKSNLNNIFDKYSTLINSHAEENKLCLIKCTDKLNFPSEELTCYDKCEVAYSLKLIALKEGLYYDFNKFFV